MMQSKKITKENAFDLIKQFAKEYRKELGKVPGEIIIVGGGSIMLNYKFRDTTQDFDVILRTVSGIKDVIAKFADDNGLPADWMNSDFMKTESYSDKLDQVSKHFYSFNNNTLEIRTVSGAYLMAMKLRAHRDYRNDLSDVAGILMEEHENGNDISYDDVSDAYLLLYEESIPEQLTDILRSFCEKTPAEIKHQYLEQTEKETFIAAKVDSYIDEGADINLRNVEEVIKKIKEHMN